MSAARLIVCEKSGLWAAALRRALPFGSLLVETRSLAQCAAALDDEAGVAAVEVTAANAAAVLAWFQRARCWPHVRLAALLEPSLAGTEPLLREAGAVDVLTSVLQAPRLARLAGRHKVPAPTSQPTIRELALQRLPWPARAAIQ